jgi:Fe2+ or Zn2+ uptake regulation protein
MKGDQLVACLLAAGLRPTSARLLLLETLYENDSFHDVETLYRNFSKRKTPIHIGTIYSALRDMHKAGLLLRVWGVNRSVHYRFRHGAEAPRFIMRCDDHRETVFSDPDLYARILSAVAHPPRQETSALPNPWVRRNAVMADNR